jgi:hypothetical protein
MIIYESFDKDLSINKSMNGVNWAESYNEEMMKDFLIEDTLVSVGLNGIRSSKTASCRISTSSLDSINKTVFNK